MNLKQISLIQIDYFLAAAHYLNFTEAAKSLYISQPSLSKQIAIFEKQIGAQLFIRTKRSVRLTPPGAVLLQELSGVKKHIENAIEKARQPNLGENSTIIIGCLEAMDTDKFLPQMINDFKAKYPRVKLIFERHSFKTLREKLINNSLDLIFTLSFEIDDSLGILWDVVYRSGTSIVMSASHPLAQRTELALSEVKNEDFVLITRDESPRGFDSVISICRKNGFTPNVVKQLPNVESLLLSIESGLWVSLFDSNIRLYKKDKFRLFPIDDDFLDVVMAWKKENLNPSIPLFTNCYFLIS